MASNRIKLCIKCREYLAVRLFRENKQRKDNLNSTCNTCLSKKKATGKQTKLQLMKHFWGDVIRQEQYEAIVAGQHRGNTCWRPQCYSMEVPNHDDE
jgi:hypothetical protein